jgi:hypothetical protein
LNHYEQPAGAIAAPLFRPKSVRISSLRLSLMTLIAPTAVLPMLPARYAIDLIVPTFLICLVFVVRSFRIRLEVDVSGVRVVNYWRKRAYSWDEVAEVTTASSPDLVSGRRIAFRTRTARRPFWAQAGVLVGRDAEEMIAAITAAAAKRGVAVILPSSS